MILHLILGGVVGVILALTGAGGGILAVPLLVFGAHLSVAQAGPVGLLAVGLAAGAGAVSGLKAGTVRYKAALLIAATGVPLSPAGLWLAHRTPNRPLTAVFAVVLLFVAYRLYRKAVGAAECAADAQRTPPCHLDVQVGRLIWTAPCVRALGMAGAIAGFLSGLLGVGGGFVMVPALQRATDLSAKSIVATSLAVIALVSLSSVAASAMSGHLLWQSAIPFSAGAVVGMFTGGWIAERLAGAHLQKGFAILCAVVALALLVKSAAGT